MKYFKRVFISTRGYFDIMDSSFKTLDDTKKKEFECDLYIKIPEAKNIYISPRPSGARHRFYSQT